jgi:hypothetical protein
MSIKIHPPKVQKAKLQSQISGKYVEAELPAELTPSQRHADIPLLIDAGELGIRQERGRITGLASEEGKAAPALQIARENRKYSIKTAVCDSCDHEVEEAALPPLIMTYALKCNCSALPTAHTVLLEER